jgi:hypothetical protein
VSKDLVHVLEACRFERLSAVLCLVQPHNRRHVEHFEDLYVSRRWKGASVVGRILWTFVLWTAEGQKLTRHHHVQVAFLRIIVIKILRSSCMSDKHHQIMLSPRGRRGRCEVQSTAGALQEHLTSCLSKAWRSYKPVATARTRPAQQSFTCRSYELFTQVASLYGKHNGPLDVSFSDWKGFHASSGVAPRCRQRKAPRRKMEFVTSRESCDV